VNTIFKKQITNKKDMPPNYASCWILFVCAFTPEDKDKEI
jgi:hypothetical protein